MPWNKEEILAKIASINISEDLQKIVSEILDNKLEYKANFNPKGGIKIIEDGLCFFMKLEARCYTDDKKYYFVCWPEDYCQIEENYSLFRYDEFFEEFDYFKQTYVSETLYEYVNFDDFLKSDKLKKQKTAYIKRRKKILQKKQIFTKEIVGSMAKHGLDGDPELMEKILLMIKNEDLSIIELIQWYQKNHRLIDSYEPGDFKKALELQNVKDILE